MNPLQRTGTLVEKRFQKLIVPQVASSLIKSAMVFIDSLVAGEFIGMTALAAIALASPILALDQMLHCLLASGISMEVTDAVGQGKREKANRIVGAILIAVLIVYALVFLTILIFIRPVFSFFSDDASLVNLATCYMIPILITLAPIEMMLVLERSYMIDGREKLFASRPVITGILNIILDIAFVTVFHCGIAGLAWATIISTFAGYFVTLSHGFHPGCTIHPDFSIVKKPLECLGYIRQNMIRGGTNAIDEGSEGIINTIICKLLSMYGGVATLAAWGIFTRIMSIRNAIGIGINVGTNLLGGTLFSEGDVYGCRSVFRKSLKYTILNSGTIMLLTLFFAPEIARIMNITPDALDETSSMLRLICPAYVCGALIIYIMNYATVLKQYRFSYTGSIVEKILVIFGVSTGAGFHTAGIFAGYAIGELLNLIYLYVVAKRHGYFMLNDSGKNELRDYSASLVSEKIVAISRDLQDFLKNKGYSEKIAHHFALFVEDGCNMICQKNPGTKVHSDIRICIRQENMVLTIVDDGMPYDISYENNWDNLPGGIENLILIRLADDVSYDRILSLNHLSIELRCDRIQEQY